ncbi:MAG: outer membrane protein assembly factor, partial [Isosphaeraceae bacterium]|nr:outer membrane protein assembly factor [Isosphaeraceae bacterium]
MVGTKRPAGPGPLAWIALAVLALLIIDRRAFGVDDSIGTISQIRFEGNRTIPDEQLRAAISSRVGRPLSRKMVNADIETLTRQKKWFTWVRADYVKDPSSQGYILTFYVQEMPVLTHVEFRGLKKLRLKDVEENTGLKKGARADHLKNLMAVNQIKRLYEEKGYEFAQVELLEGGKPGDTRVVFQIFEGPKCRLSSIKFVGNTFVSDAVLRTKISSRPPLIGSLGGRYYPEAPEEDARKLIDYYQGQGFFEVEVTPVKSRGANLGDIVLTFVISEGIQYKVRNIRFEGNEKIPAAKLREGLALHSGRPYSDALRDADLNNLKAKYGSIGCIDVEINPERKVTDQPGIVDLVYQIKEGEPYLLGRMIVRGNGRTKTKVLLREANMAGLVPGEPLDANRIKTYEQRLQNLKYFNMNPEMGKPISVKIVNRRPPDQPYGELGPPIDLNEVVRTRMQGPD